MERMSVDPSYPLLPVAGILCSVLLLLVLATSFLRQSWNIGVAALCFWLVVDNLTNSINSILWADNADVKAEVYCDIVTHIQIFVSIVRPACSLVITRRLYKIASRRSVDMADMPRRAQRLDRSLDIFLIFILPATVTGLYYINQGRRFEVIEGFGCEDTYSVDGVAIILLQSWLITLSLTSTLFYIPKILWTFYHVKRETSHFLSTNDSLSRNFYFRILLLGCLDVVFTLPLGIANLVIAIKLGLENDSLPFYWGWTFIHTGWYPLTVSYAELQSLGTWDVADRYLVRWGPIVLGYIIFALFGLTAEARTMYLTWFYRAIGGSPPIRNPALSDIVFGTRDLHPDSSVNETSQGGVSAGASLEEGKPLEEVKNESIQARSVQDKNVEE